MTVLVIDDDPAQRRTLGGFLGKLGYRTLEAESGEAGLALAGREGPVHIVISDIRMPGIDGLEVLRRLRAGNPELAVLLVTAFATYPQAVEAVQSGAWDYLPKPLDLDELRVRLVKMERELGLEGVTTPEAVPTPDGFVARSRAMEEVLDLLGRAAESDATVLLLGESGTGKSMLADWVHRRSHRAGGPFISVSCAAIPETLIESELFGHERGAFTGADKARAGRFETADGGTLFLDEIGDVPLPTQVKLLTVLQDRTVERLGSSGKPRRVDVRVIAATNQSLSEQVSRGEFREDLYYRLNVLAVEVPPLRTRREDIPPLIESFMGQHTPADRPAPSLSPEAEAVLLHHEYPGNVRELGNAVERAVILARGNVIRPNDLPPSMSREETGVRTADSLPDAVEQLERELIVRELHAVEGVQTRAADRLGITERNLRYKMKKYGMHLK